MNNNEPFKLTNRSGGAVNLLIRGYIGGWDADSDFVRDTLANLGEVDNIEVTLESFGGSAMHGMAIYTALKNHPASIAINIEAIAASAAATIAMAASPGMLSMENTALMMIHEAEIEVLGRASDLRNRAKFIDKVNSTVRAAISNRKGVKLSDSQIASAMTETTWYTPQEAMEAGLVDSIRDTGEVVTNCLNVSESFDISKYKNLPDRVKNLSIKSASNGEPSDGLTVNPPLSKVDMKTFTKEELDQAVKNSTDALMERINRVLAHPNATNMEASLLIIQSSDPIESALKMMDFVQVTNAATVAPVVEKKEEVAENDAIKLLIENMGADILSKVQKASNVDIPTNEDDPEEVTMSDEDRGRAAGARAVANGGNY